MNRSAKKRKKRRPRYRTARPIFLLVFVFLAHSGCTHAQSGSGKKVIINSLGMKMMRIEPGSFRMGSPKGETRLKIDRWDERRHRVTITRPFYMSTTEVTNAQYEQFDPDHRTWRGLRGASTRDGEAVNYVSWREARAFCRWLSKKEGVRYRLPTEAEWEYAARAGTDTAYWTGNRLSGAHHRNQWRETADRRVNRKDRALRKKKGKGDVSLDVDTIPPNPWGLRAMHGNVEEWVRNWYAPYPDGPRTDPLGPENGLFKITRGGSHNTALKFLRSANRSATLPQDKHWLIGFRVVRAPLPDNEPRSGVPFSMNDTSVNPEPARWNEPSDQGEFHGPIPFVRPDKEHPLLGRLPHHHHPTITWCENGDLLAAWFNTISEIGREMVIVSSRLRYEDGEWANRWDTERLFFAPADRNTTGSCLLHDGRGRLYYINAIADSGHHRDQCMIMSISENSGRTWSRPRIISDLYHRHKYNPMDSAFVEKDGGQIVISVDYAPVGEKAVDYGSGVFIRPDRGETWIDRITGKSAPEVASGNTGPLAAGFHPGTVRLRDGRLLAMTRTQGGWDIDGKMTMSFSEDNGKTWTYRASPFPPIGSTQRLVLMRLNEGLLFFVSFAENEIFASLSYDEGKTWTDRIHIDDGSHGYMAATQTPDNRIHLITSKNYYRFNLPWLKQAVR